MHEAKFNETSVETEWIKYNTNDIKTGSSKNVDLLEVKRKLS